MSIHSLAGKPAPAELLIDLGRLERDYYQQQPVPPDAKHPDQIVSFGTSGHRGTPTDGTFTEAHILAMTQAICEQRKARNISGPMFVGKDSHAVSAPAERSALEVLAANGVETFLHRNNGFTPTPVVSRAILSWNRLGKGGQADGLVITPSHNPPADGGIKYNPPNGGPADTDITAAIQKRANELLKHGNRDVKRLPFEKALRAPTTHEQDFITPYVEDLAAVIDMEAIRAAGVRIGVDPLGGASLPFWEPIRERYGLNLTVVNPKVDGTFGFMSVDHDGKIRMDCSSPWAMRGLVQLQSKFDLAFGNDPDADRHGIVTPSHGLMDPNHYLATAIHFLHTRRPSWSLKAAIGKTVVSSAIIDRVVQSIGRRLAEVPVGFKWFAKGLFEGTYCFGGEESAGASFLRRDGTVWTTDKDGLILGLLAAEICAKTGADPAQYFQHLAGLFGRPYYKRIDAKTTPEQKQRFKGITAQSLGLKELGGDAVVSTLTNDPENNAPLGGIKVSTAQGWFAARPSGTENIVKIYAESFRSEEHLQTIIRQAQAEIDRLTGSQ